MKKKWIVIPSLLLLTAIDAYAIIPMWRLGPKPVVDSAIRVETVDTLVAKLNNHYVFPDKAKQMEAVLRQRQHAGKYDRVTDGEQLAKQLTDDLRSVLVEDSVVHSVRLYGGHHLDWHAGMKPKLVGLFSEKTDS